jgi:hypothetical protein
MIVSNIRSALCFPYLSSINTTPNHQKATNKGVVNRLRVPFCWTFIDWLFKKVKSLTKGFSCQQKLQPKSNLSHHKSYSYFRLSFLGCESKLP